MIKNLIFFILMFIHSFSIASAQDNSSYTSTSLDGTLSFNYPHNWSLLEESGIIYLSDTPNLFANGLEAISQADGTLTLTIASIEEMLHKTMPEATFEEKMLAFHERLQRDALDSTVIEPPEFAESASWTSATFKIDNTAGQNIGRIFLLEIDDRNFVFITAVAPLSKVDAFLSATLEIIESLQYTPLPSAEIVWKSRGQAILSPMAMDIGPNDSIYIANRDGFLILTADGQAKTEVNLPYLNYGYYDMAVDLDGSIWTIDYEADAPRIRHFDIAGKEIASWTPNLYHDANFYFPIQIDAGADGKLYLLSVSIGEDSKDVACWFQVFDKSGNLQEEFFTEVQTQIEISLDPVHFVVAEDSTVYIDNLYTIMKLPVETRTPLPIVDLGNKSIDAFSLGLDNSIYVATVADVFHFDSSGNLIGIFETSNTFLDTPHGREIDAGTFDMGIQSNGNIIVANSTLVIEPFRWQILAVKFSE